MSLTSWNGTCYPLVHSSGSSRRWPCEDAREAALLADLGPLLRMKQVRVLPGEAAVVGLLGIILIYNDNIYIYMTVYTYMYRYRYMYININIYIYIRTTYMIKNWLVNLLYGSLESLFNLKLWGISMKVQGLLLDCLPFSCSLQEKAVQEAVEKRSVRHLTATPH